MKDNVYTNEELGFSITLNPNTSYVSKEDRINTLIADYFTNQDSLKAMLDEKEANEKKVETTNDSEANSDQPKITIDYTEAETKYGQPFDVSKSKYLPLLTFNLTNDEKPTKISINAESIDKSQKKESEFKPEHFYEIIKIVLESTRDSLPVKAELEMDDLTETNLGGVTFNRIDSKLIIEESKLTLNQVLYFKILDKYILTMQATYKDGEIESIEKILNTIKFN